jgi:DNA-binding NtrC family response regulator
MATDQKHHARAAASPFESAALYEPRRHVLIVDDDVTLLNAIAAALELHLPKIVPDLCNAAPLALTRAEAVLYDLLIADILMPGTDGLDLVRELRRRNIHMPVILMTGAVDSTYEAQAAQLGAVAFLTKPFESETLVQAIRSALEQRGGQGTPSTVRR